jgi:flavorubredoxin
MSDIKAIFNKKINALAATRFTLPSELREIKAKKITSMSDECIVVTCSEKDIPRIQKAISACDGFVKFSMS